MDGTNTSHGATHDGHHIVLVPARKPGDGKLKVLGDAPDTYVKVKAS